MEDVYNGNKPNMKLQLVSFEQALALKELGYSQDDSKFCYPVITVRMQNTYEGYPYSFSPGDIINLLEESANGSYFIGIVSDDDLINAPSLEEVAKWLRDEKNLWIEISKGGYEKSAHCFLGDYIYEDATHIKEFNSYEEALSAGIDKAIKILKKNDND